MSVITDKIRKQTTSLQKKIDSLSGTYLTNTWKRQQEQKWRDTQIERFRLQKQILEYLEEESGCRELTVLETALITSAFYEDMRAFLAQKKHADERPGYSYLPQGGITNTRFNKIGICSAGDLTAAISAFEDLVRKATIPADPNALKIRDLTFHARLRQEGDIQFTPEKVVRQLLFFSGADTSSRVLEPSAGIGNIADRAKEIAAQVDCIEPMHDFRELLRLKGHNLIGQDLLQCPQSQDYDAVIMNPPFSDECRHIRYAYDFLKPGGKLVAVCCIRVLESDSKKYVTFREWLSCQNYRFEDAAEKFEMTGTNTKILVIERPATAA